MSNYTDITDIFTESYSEAFETHHEEEGRERRELGRLLEIYDAIASWNEFGAGFYIAIGDNFTHSRRAFVIRSRAIDGEIQTGDNLEGGKLWEDMTETGIKSRTLEEFAELFGEKLGKMHRKAAAMPYK